MHYTLRADLLPHTEQVMFIKSSIFGDPIKYIVDLKDLKKINYKEVPNAGFMWAFRAPDRDMVWKDERSGEIFIMDVAGLWNESGINHPLIS